MGGFVFAFVALLVCGCSASHSPAGDGGSGTDVGCSACVGSPVSWGLDGGLSCVRESSSLGACRTFSHAAIAELCDPLDRSCMDEIPACDASAVGPGDVAAALGHPDVVAAVAAAPVLYGGDPRSTDGAGFFVTIGAARIEVGTCADTSCAEIPAGVRALRSLLETLEAEALDRGTCASVFGGR